MKILQLPSFGMKAPPYFLPFMPIKVKILNRFNQKFLLFILLSSPDEDFKKSLE
jgi:hypothetical protein